MNAFIEKPARRARRRCQAASALLVLAASAGPAFAGPPSVEGVWSDVVPWPRIPIHASLLPDGKVTTFGATPQGNQGGLDVDVWDPKLGLGADAHVTLPNGIDIDSFCVGQVLEPWSGDLFMVGGSTNAADDNTLKTARFSFKTRTMTRLEKVKYPRWYATTTSLPDGRILANGGVLPYAGSENASTTAEIYTPNQGWRTLDGTTQPRQDAADRERRYWYPEVFPMSADEVFVVAGKVMYTLGYKGAGSVGKFQPFNGPNWGGTSSAVLFAPRKILKFGGGITHNEDQSAPPGSKEASVIDFSRYPYGVARTGSMAFGRHWATGTLLPNGEVLATGGAEGNNTLAGVAYAAEIWNPATGQWRTGASMKIPRLYHSSALLLPDGRVFSGGGGAPGPVFGNNAEIYSPPYLFGADGRLAERPAITTEPGIVQLGQSFSVEAGGPSPIARFTMVKTGSVTHSFNVDQRFLELPFRREGERYRLSVTADAQDATPGYYMLFALDQRGVPSIARMIRIPSPMADNGDLPPKAENGDTGGLGVPGGLPVGGTPKGTGTLQPEGEGGALVAAGSKLCLAVAGNSDHDGAELVQDACAAGSAVQKWTFKAAEGGFLIVNGQSNKCVDVLDFNHDEGGKLVQWPCWGGPQIWQVRKTSHGNALISTLSGKCMDVIGDARTAGARVGQSTCRDIAQQSFNAPGGGGEDPGTPELLSLAAAPLLSRDSQLCLSVKGNAETEGAAIVQEGCRGEAAQNWGLKKVADGFEVRNAKSNKCLDVHQSGMGDGARVVQAACQGERNQIWQTRATPTGTALVSAVSGRCLDVSAASRAPGAEVFQWACHNGANQAWVRGKIAETPTTPTPTPETPTTPTTPNPTPETPTTPVPTPGTPTTPTVPETPTASNPPQGAVPLVLWHSKLCLAIQGDSAANGAAVVQRACNGAAAENWTFKKRGGGYDVVNAATGKCLDVAAGGQANGVRLIQWSCAGDAEQIFSLRAANGRIGLQAAHSGKCLDVVDRSSAAGAALAQWTCESVDSQSFSAGAATPTPDTPTVPPTTPATPATPGVPVPASGASPLVAQHSKLCLAVRDGSKANGAPVVQETCSGAAAQNWTFEARGAGYLVVNEASRKCLDVTAGGRTDGVRLIQWTCANDPEQIFKLRAEAGGRHSRPPIPANAWMSPACPPSVAPPSGSGHARTGRASPGASGRRRTEPSVRHAP